MIPIGSNSSHAPLKPFASFTTTIRTGTTPQVSISSRCEGLVRSRDPIDVELGQIDGDTHQGSQVRVDRGFEQREERL